MPIYDFICLACGKDFETLVLVGDKVECPQCKSTDLKKQMSVFSSRTGSGETGSSSGTNGGGCAGCAGGDCGSCR